MAEMALDESMRERVIEMLRHAEAVGVVVPGSWEVRPDGSFKAVLTGAIKSVKVDGTIKT